jgi:hypothetical protein
MMDFSGFYCSKINEFLIISKNQAESQFFLVQIINVRFFKIFLLVCKNEMLDYHMSLMCYY